MPPTFDPHTKRNIDNLATALKPVRSLFKVNNNPETSEIDRHFIILTKRGAEKPSMFSLTARSEPIASAPGATPVLSILKTIAASQPDLVKSQIENDTYMLSRDLVDALAERGVQPVPHIQLAEGTTTERR